MWTRQELKFRAKQAYKRNYGNSVGAAFLMGLFSTSVMTVSQNYQTIINNSESDGGNIYSLYLQSAFGLNHIPDSIMNLFGILVLMIGMVFVSLRFFVGNVLEVGGDRFFVKNQTEDARISVLLDGFKNGNYGNVFLTMLLKDVYIMLWTCLFVIPGIIKSYEYMMVPYILAENPSMNRKEAFLISKQMMQGEKWNAFVLGLSFIGWEILSTVTCGILGILMVKPYEEATFAEFYSVNKEKAFREGYIR